MAKVCRGRSAHGREDGADQRRRAELADTAMAWHPEVASEACLELRPAAPSSSSSD